VLVLAAKLPLNPPQMQDFLKMYSNLVEKCFNSCVNDFTSKAMSSKEVCILSDGHLYRVDACTQGTMRFPLHRQVY